MEPIVISVNPIIILILSHTTAFILGMIFVVVAASKYGGDSENNG